MTGNYIRLSAVSLTALFWVATSASAELSVRFIEGAPKDRFSIENAGDCTIQDSVVRLDLSTSQGALIFDVSSSGAGVEVFQPFELVEGQQFLVQTPVVSDGMSVVDLEIENLPPGGAVAFTIDVDDTLGEREITVTGSEIQGATVSVLGSDGLGVFSSQSTAQVATIGC